jgi:hypothetical protein
VPSGAPVSLELRLPRGGAVAADVYDVAGRHVSALARDVLPPGTHVVRWDGRAPGGAPVSAGIYLVRVETDGAKLARRVVVLR